MPKIVKNILVIFFLFCFINGAFAFYPAYNGGFELGNFDGFLVGDGNSQSGNQGDWNRSQFHAKEFLDGNGIIEGTYSLRIEADDCGAGCNTLEYLYLNEFGELTDGNLSISSVQFKAKLGAGSPNASIRIAGANNIDTRYFTAQSCSGAPFIINLTSTDINAFSIPFTNATCIDETYKYPILFMGSGDDDLVFYIDSFQLETVPALSVSITETQGDPVPIDTDFNINVSLTDINSGISITDAVCYINFTDSGVTEMDNLGTGVYSANYNLAVPKTYDYNITCSKSGYISGAGSGSITANIDLRNYLTITPISNIQNYSINVNDVTFNLSNDETGTMTFKVENSYTSALNVNYITKNSNNTGKQYSIYTATQTEYNNGNWNLSDSLTFGATYDDPIQKIFNLEEEKYFYSYDDYIESNGTFYYKLVYTEPYGYWRTMNGADLWDVQLLPFVADLNSTSWDIYQLSQYANIRNKYIKKIPDTESSFNDNLALQFNGSFELATAQNIQVGQVLSNGTDSTNDYAISNTEKRYSFTVLPDYPLFKTNNSTVSTVYLGEYSLITRGYFTETLKIKTVDGLDLPLKIGDNNNYFSYLLEGQPFRVQTQVYDPTAKLDYFEISAYIDGVNDQNKVNYYKFEFDDEGYININERLDGIFDLTANAPDRFVKIVLKVVDDDEQYSEIQSKWIKLLQFPHFPDDLFFTFSQLNRKLGDNPEGSVYLRLDNTALLRGLNFNIEDSDGGDTNTADFNITLYKGQDFTCKAFDCSFDYKINEYIFPRPDNYRMTGTVLVTTEYDNSDNPLLSKTISFPVFAKEIETARIFEGLERGDHTYRNDEEIFLVLQMRDGDFSNLRNDFDVVLTYEECDADDAGVGAGNCRPIDVNFKPDSFAYDNKTSYNYWFFKQLFYEENFTPLSDGNYFRFYAIVEDKEKKHATIIRPLLTTKCNTNNVLEFFSNLFNMNLYSFGCDVDQGAIVTLDYNSGQENRLLIDEDHILTQPTQEAFICRKPDNANKYGDPLSQDLDCTVLYTLGEQIPEKFYIRLTNEYSDTAEKRDEYKQYIEYTVPYQEILLNDPYLIEKALETEFNTEIDTIADIVYWGFNKIFTGFANPLADITVEQFNRDQNGVFVNYGADVNFSALYNPANISGLMFYKIKGIKVINVYDYRFDEDLKNAPPKNFIKYIASLEKTIPDPKTEIKVYANDFEEIRTASVNSKLVINQEITDEQLNRNNTDYNNNPDFITVPTILNFDIVHMIIFDNERKTLIAYIPFKLLTVLTSKAGILDEFLAGVNCAVNGTCNPFDNVINWFYKNVLIITLVLMILIILAYLGFIRPRGG